MLHKMKLFVIFLSLLALSHQRRTEKCSIVSQNKVKCIDYATLDNIYDFLIKQKNVTIEHFECFCCDMLMLPPSIFDMDVLKSLKRLTIIQSGLAAIDSKAFDGLDNLEHLEIRSNKIDTLVKHQFSTPNLRILNINNNEIMNLEPFVFENLKNLEKLSLNSNSLESIQENIFSGLEKLTDLSLENNLISDIHKNAFDNLKVEKINLDSNEIKQIDYQVFTPISSLKTLKLSNNNIMSIESVIEIPSLENFDISNNKITKVFPKAFHRLNNLIALNLLGNDEIQLNQNEQFLNLKSLTSLELPKHVYRNITMGFFNGLLSIKTLDLSNCFIEALTPGMFVGLTNLDNLDLSNNNISVLEADSFIGLDNLFALDIDDNPIISMKPLAFNGLVNLKEFDLPFFKIVKLENNYFSGLESLMYLDLSERGIQEIAPDAFKGLNNLKHLDLSYNKLSHLSGDIFVPSLELLNLAYNNINEIAENTFANMETLRVLNISHNELVNMDSFVHPLKNVVQLDVRHNKLVVIDFEKFTCQDAANLTQMYIDENGWPCSHLSKMLGHFQALNIEYRTRMEHKTDPNIDGISCIRLLRFTESLTVTPVNNPCGKKNPAPEPSVTTNKPVAGVIEKDETIDLEVVSDGTVSIVPAVSHSSESGTSLIIEYSTIVAEPIAKDQFASYQIFVMPSFWIAFASAFTVLLVIGFLLTLTPYYKKWSSKVQFEQLRNDDPVQIIDPSQA